MEFSTIMMLMGAACCAAFIQRVSGFGFGIFIMTLLPYILPSYGECTALSGLLAMVTSAIITVRMHKFIGWRKLIPILLTFIVVSFFAIQFVSIAADGLLKKILGVTLIGASIWFLWLNDRIKVKPSTGVQISMGTLSGMMGGLFGMQGPPAVLYFIATAKSKEEYMALAQCYFLTGNIIMTLFRARNGFVTMAVVEAWLCGVVAVLAGTYLGTIAFKKLELPMLRKIIYLYMAVSGVIALFV